jgi:hypothetical protein
MLCVCVGGGAESEDTVCLPDAVEAAVKGGTLYSAGLGLGRGC